MKTANCLLLLVLALGVCHSLGAPVGSVTWRRNFFSNFCASRYTKNSRRWNGCVACGVDGTTPCRQWFDIDEDVDDDLGSVGSVTWRQNFFSNFCASRYTKNSQQWNGCVACGVDGTTPCRQWFDIDEDVDDDLDFGNAWMDIDKDVEDDRDFKCDTPLPTRLSGKMFAYEAIKERPFCGRMVYMDKTDQLLKEGPKTCHYSQSSCSKPGDVLRKYQVRAQNVKGSIYFNCFITDCLPSWYFQPTRRRLRKSYVYSSP